ncbi:hypothetical protein QTN25_007367 [Entamoeba marina]
MSKVNVVMYGEPKTGKTSFINAVVNKSFDDDYASTDSQQQIQFNMEIQKYQLKCVSLITHASNGPIHIFMISKDSPKSLNFVRNYIEGDDYTTVPHDVIAFVMNKMDCSENDEMLEEAKTLAEQNSAVYLEISCKNQPEVVSKSIEQIIQPYMVKNKLFESKQKSKKCVLF